MITPQETIVALKYLHDTGHVRATDGQGVTWADVINTAVPEATRADLVTACRTYAAEAVESWTTIAHVIPHIRRAYAARTRPVWCGTCDERARQVTAEDPDGRPVVIRCPACHPTTTKQLTNH